MLFPIKKWINIILLIAYILLILIIIPLPSTDKIDETVPIKKDQLKFVVVEEGQYSKFYGKNFPVFTYGRDGMIHIITTPATESYIEAEFNVPERGTTFSYAFDSTLCSSATILLDSKGIQHVLTEKKYLEGRDYYWSGYKKYIIKEFDISQFAGQNIKIRIKPTAAPLNAKPHYTYHHNYGVMVIHIKQYTLNDNLLLFLNTLKYIIVFSLISGFIAGFSKISIFIQLTETFHALVLKNYNLFSKNDRWYIKYYLNVVLSIANTSLQYVDKINNQKIRTSIKTAIMVGLPIMVIYITKVIVYIIVIVTIAILIFALIMWIIFSLLGGSPSGGSIGGGGGSGGGGGKDYTTKYGKTYDPETDERVVKQDGKTYRRGSIFELDAGWHADKEWSGGDKVERDWDGSPKTRRDVTGKQIIEGDLSGDPIIEPESEQDK